MFGYWTWLAGLRRVWATWIVERGPGAVDWVRDRCSWDVGRDWERRGAGRVRVGERVVVMVWQRHPWDVAWIWRWGCTRDVKVGRRLGSASCVFD